MSLVGEEVLASLIGSLLVQDSSDAMNLVRKATIELVRPGLVPATAEKMVNGIRNILEEFL